MHITKKNLCIALVLLIFAFLLALFFRSKAKSVSAGEVSGVRLAVIMYHSVRAEKVYSGSYVITPELLESDLKYLKENGYNTVSVRELYDYTTIKGASLPENPVLLSFDDGYYNNYLYVLPLLEKYGAKAVISVVGKYSDEYSASPQAVGYSYLTWEQIAELSSCELVEIGNHSYDMHDTHARFGVKKQEGESEEAYVGAVRGDIEKMQGLLKERCGIKCQIFAYPFGNFDALGKKTVDEFGFICTLSCAEGLNLISYEGSLQLLKRYNRPSGVQSDEFFQKIFIQTP